METESTPLIKRELSDRHGSSSTISTTASSHHERHLGTFETMSLIINRIIGTGIFSTPAIVFSLCNGSIGVSILVWLFGGFLVTFSGLSVYLEFGLKIPRNGGEKNYLQYVFTKPKHLIDCVYAMQIVLLGFSSGNSFAFGKYILYVCGIEDDWLARIIGCGVILSCTWLHIRHKLFAKNLIVVLGAAKILILFAIVSFGVYALLNPEAVPPQYDNFTTISWSFKGQDVYSLSLALLQVIYSFKGWENANYVLDEIVDPERTLMIAAPMSVLLTTVLYIAIVLCYYLVIPYAEISSTGVLICGVYFEKIFASTSSRVLIKALSLIITLSNYGNVLSVSFSNARINQKLSLEWLLPFSRVFQNLKNALWLHCVVTILVLILPPNGDVYQLVVDLYAYPGTWMNFLVCTGLLYLKFHDQEWNSRKCGYTSNIFLTVVFLLSNLFMAVMPFIPPSQPTNDGYPYWVVPVTGVSILASGALYWFTKRHQLSKL